jgi:hypothetical protein
MHRPMQKLSNYTYWNKISGFHGCSLLTRTMFLGDGCISDILQILTVLMTKISGFHSCSLLTRTMFLGDGCISDILQILTLLMTAPCSSPRPVDSYISTDHCIAASPWHHRRRPHGQGTAIWCHYRQTEYAWTCRENYLSTVSSGSAIPVFQLLYHST